MARDRIHRGKRARHDDGRGDQRARAHHASDHEACADRERACLKREAQGLGQREQHDRATCGGTLQAIERRRGVRGATPVGIRSAHAIEARAKGAPQHVGAALRGRVGRCGQDRHAPQGRDHEHTQDRVKASDGNDARGQPYRLADRGGTGACREPRETLEVGQRGAILRGIGDASGRQDAAVDGRHDRQPRAAQDAGAQDIEHDEYGERGRDPRRRQRQGRSRTRRQHRVVEREREQGDGELQNREPAGEQKDRENRQPPGPEGRVSKKGRSTGLLCSRAAALSGPFPYIPHYIY